MAVIPLSKVRPHTGTCSDALFGKGVKPGPLAPMKTYSDGGQILAHHLGLTLKRGTFQEVMDHEAR